MNEIIQYLFDLFHLQDLIRLYQRSVEVEYKTVTNRNQLVHWFDVSFLLSVLINGVEINVGSVCEI